MPYKLRRKPMIDPCRLASRAVVAADVKAGREKHGELMRSLPATRDGCPKERPCLFVTCRHHLYCDVNKKGGIHFNYPGVDVAALEHSCALDYIDSEGMTLEDVAKIMKVSRERVRQIEAKALKKIRGMSKYHHLAKELSMFCEASVKPSVNYLVRYNRRS